VKQVSISLARRNESRKFPESTLDAYSLKKYNTFYQESKTKVNADIKALSIKYQTIVPKEITMLLFAEMLPLKTRKIFLEKYSKWLSKKH